MRKKMSKPGLTTWLPFGLWRIDKYFIAAYIKTLVLILLAMAVLVTIGDAFQRFDDFIFYSRENNLELWDIAPFFFRYYAAFAPQLILQYMFPLSMLLAAAITATSSFAGPRGNNEYTVIRSVGIPVRRTIMPLVIPAIAAAVAFQGARDFFLPDMVRTRNDIANMMNNRTSAPVNISLIHNDDFQSASVGWFSPDAIGYNVIIEVRNVHQYQRGDSRRGDNDFVAFRANRVSLEPIPNAGGYQWRPLEAAEAQVFTRFSRRVEPWTIPIPTSLTPAMIERQTLGDAVCSWEDLLAMRHDNSGARFEIHWRLADPVGAGILLILGLALIMGRMLRGKSPTYIQAIIISMLTTGGLYVLRLFGKSLWESGALSPVEAAWLPLAAAFLFAVPAMVWMER